MATKTNSTRRRSTKSGPATSPQALTAGHEALVAKRAAHLRALEILTGYSNPVTYVQTALPTLNALLGVLANGDIDPKSLAHAELIDLARIQAQQIEMAADLIPEVQQGGVA